MIHSLKITDPTKTPIKYLSKIPALKEPREFKFQSGLNILAGKTGSGKSTVIKLMGTLLHCLQGGVPMITTISMQELYGRSFDRDKDDFENLRGIELYHDGQGVSHCDVNQTVGLFGGAFDANFFGRGVSSAMFKGSSGQTTLDRLGTALSAITANKAPSINIKYNAFHDEEKAKLGVADTILRGNIKEKGPITILLDEPDRSIDLQYQFGLWSAIRKYSNKIQFIIASHNLFAFDIPNANYIEMSEGYIKIASLALKHLETWKDKKFDYPDKKESEKEDAKKD
jgi:predicted ATPase